MDKLQALRIFCAVADTLQFRETAKRLAISPQVVSRIIGELEQELGDTLFQRNTRQVRLSDFGQQLFPAAKRIVAESDQLFSVKNRAKSDDLEGIVRITVPNAPLMTDLLPLLLARLAPYPKLHLDWRTDMKLSDKVAERIDLGIRMGTASEDNSLIVRKALTFHEKIVAAPSLIARLGEPKNWQDLTENYPLAAFIHDSYGRLWAWELNDEWRFQPVNPHFAANHLPSLKQAALSGQCVALLHDRACTPHLQRGELVELLPDLPRRHWGVYVYRPQRQITHPRVKLVFELLVNLLSQLA